MNQPIKRSTTSNNNKKKNNGPRRRPRPKVRPPPVTNVISQYPKTTVQPVSKIEDLVFTIPTTKANNPGGPIVSDDFLLNDGYDFQPSFLTPTVQFMNYLFTLYSKAKVLYVDFLIEFGNLEQNPIDLYFFSTANNIVGSVSTLTELADLAGTGVCIWHQQMSEQYGKDSTVRFTKRIVPSKTLGNALEYNGSDDYSFTSSSGPPKLVYGSWYAASPLPIIPSGITVRITATLHTLFYNMKVLTFSPLSNANEPITRKKRDSSRYSSTQRIISPTS